MEVMMDPTFWGEVGLSVAARLALLAAVVWVARMAVNRPGLAASPSLRHANSESSPVPHHRFEPAPAPAPATAEPTFLNLKPRPVPATAGGPHGATHDRLMQYVQRRAIERMPS